MLFISFLIAATVLAITPGPGIAYVVARTVSGGRKEGLASCLGTGLGGFVHVFAAAVGISVAITESAIAFTVIKYLGAVYLMYLGIRLFFSNRESIASHDIPSVGIKRAFLEGVVVEALNVKTALFFLAFLPQFTSADQPLMMQLVLLGSICVFLNTLVDVMAVMLTQRLIAMPLWINPERLLTRASGVTLIGLGAYLGSAER